MISLNFIRESPTNNCLTSALQRSLSQTNDIAALGAPNVSFADYLNEESPAAPTVLFSQIPAENLECSESPLEKWPCKDSNGTTIKPVTVWRTAKKI